MNFGTDICLLLETYMKEYFGSNTLLNDTIYSRGEIEHNSYIECMLFLIRVKSNFICYDSEINNFVDELKKLLNVKQEKLNSDEKNEIFEKFKNLYLKKE